MNGDHAARLMPPGIPKYLVTGDMHVAPEYPFLGVFLKPRYLDDIRRVIAAKQAGKS